MRERRRSEQGTHARVGWGIGERRRATAGEQAVAQGARSKQAARRGVWQRLSAVTQQNHHSHEGRYSLVGAESRLVNCHPSSRRTTPWGGPGARRHPRRSGREAARLRQQRRGSHLQFAQQRHGARSFRAPPPRRAPSRAAPYRWRRKELTKQGKQPSSASSSASALCMSRYGTLPVDEDLLRDRYATTAQPLPHHSARSTARNSN